MSKQIKDYEGYTIYRDGKIMGRRGKFLQPWIGRGGYLKVCLKYNGNVRWVYVHRLMCETYLDNPLNKKEINHIDGNKLNNALSNLQWVTRSENGLHAFKNKLNDAPKGENNGVHKLSYADVLSIRAMQGVKKGVELSKEYGVNKGHICNIQKNRYWKDGKSCVKEVANV
jgi:hypothetical protein